MAGLWTRRAALAACAAPALLGAFPALSSTGPARRDFRILRDGDDIGSHVLTARREGARLTVEIDIAIAVQFLGITAYRYELRNREVWEDGRILTIDSTVNDDGEPGFCNVRREGDALRIEGSGYSGPAPADAATTSYWSADFLSRGVWISTQSGEPLSVSAADQGPETIESGDGPLACRRWAISGDMDLELWYDAAGDWTANAFDAGGEKGRYRLQSGGDSLNALWTASGAG
jgi:hypothetical protein